MQRVLKWFKTKAMPRGGWGSVFHKNAFYKVTPISGWIFVYKAKTAKELLFWYMVCLIFLIIAFYNVLYLFRIFYSRPTHSQIVFRTSTKDVDMPNMTLEINLPFTELLTYLPLPFSTHNEVPRVTELQGRCTFWNWDDDIEMQTKWKEFVDRNPFWKDHITAENRLKDQQTCAYRSVDDPSFVTPQALTINDNLQLLYRYLCHEPHAPAHATLETERFILSESRRVQNKSLDQLLTFENDLKSKWGLINDAVLQEWLNTMGKQQKRYINFWKDILSMPLAKQEKLDINNQLSTVTNVPLSERSNDTLLKLLSLEAVQLGTDPRLKLINEQLSNERHVKEVLDGLGKSIGDLIDHVQSDLASMIHFNITGASLVFKDWTAVASSNDYLWNEPEQKISFAIVVPKGTRHVQIDFYSFVHMWHSHILKALLDLAYDLSIQYNYEFLYELCPNEIQIEDKIRETHSDHEELYVPMIRVVNDRIRLTPGYITNIMISPDHHFTSKIDKCFETENCMDKCLKERTFAECHCIPWTLGIDDHSTICSERCADDQIRDECNLECIEKLHHPCNFMLPQLSKELMKFNHTDWFITADEPLCTAVIHMPELYNFIESIEEYEISGGAFLAQIGGAFEFWSGINVICIVHFLFYILFNTKLKIHIDGLFSAIKIRLRLSSGESKVEPINQTEKNQPLRAVEHELIESIDRTRNRILKALPDSETQKRRHKYWWLKENRFYKLTPMAGYRYIAAAKQKLEVFVWYMFILVLGIVTTSNLYATIRDYRTRPTRIVILPAAAQDQQLPNMTLKLHLPLIELSNFELAPKHDPDLTAFHLMDLHLNSAGNSITANDLYTDVLNKWIEAFHHGKWPQFSHQNNDHKSILSLADIGTLAEWQAQLDDSQRILTEQAQRRAELSEDELGQVHANLWSVLSGRAGDLGVKLFLLRALYSDNMEYPETTNMSMRSRLSGNIVRSHNMSINVREILKNEFRITPAQLLQQTFSHLSKMIHISTDQPGTKAYATDFYFHQNALKYDLDFVIEINVLLPEKLSQIRIDVYTFIHCWFQALYQWLTRLEYHGTDDRFWYLAQIHAFDLVATGMIVYHDNSEGYLYLSTSIKSDSSLEDKAQMAVLIPVGTASIDIQTSWQMISHTADCKNMKQDICLESCINDRYLSHCSCYPWHLFYMNNYGNADMCEQQCSLIVHKLLSDCSKSCNPCHRISYRDLAAPETSGVYSYNEKRQTASLVPLFTGEAKFRQVTYPQLIEEYEETFGALLSKIGGILDFWLGVNLLALVHLIVFAAKHLLNTIKQKRSDNSNKMLAKAQGLKKEIGELKEQINDTMNKQKQVAHTQLAISNDHERSKGWRSKFYWMRGNTFFDETSLTGFEFISRASSNLEVAFWWILILVFCILTLTNIWQAIHIYSLRPKHINVNVTTGTDAFEIGNITLEMNMLLIELSRNNPTFFSFKYPNVNAGTVVEQVACSLLTSDQFDILYFQDMAETMFHQWILMLNQPWDNITSKQNIKPNSLNDPKVFEKWKAKLSKGSAAIKSFLKTNGVKPKGPQLEQEFSKLMNIPSQISENSALKLMLLHAMNRNGIDPKERLYNLLMDPNNHAFLTNMPEPGEPELMPIEQYFKHFTTNKLVHEGFNEISKFLHIMLDDPGVKIYVKDWNYGPGEQKPGFNMIKDQSLELLLQVPSETRQITIKIYSYMHMWLEMILGSFTEYFIEELAVLGIEYVMCDQNKPSEMVHVYDIYESSIIALRQWSQSLKEGRRLKVSRNKGNQYFIYSYEIRQELTLVPSSYLESNTQNCYSGTMDFCVDECVLNSHRKLCKCRPWNLLHVGSNKTQPICAKTCTSAEMKEKCATECEQILLHPCKMGGIDYTFEYSESFPTDYELGEHVPLYEFSIRIPKRSQSYMIYRESYTMTFGDFIAQMGGLFDLWMGLNLLSIIHMVVFAIRQAIVSKIAKKQGLKDKSMAPVARAERVRQRLIQQVEELEKDVELEIIKLSKVTGSNESRQEHNNA